MLLCDIDHFQYNLHPILLSVPWRMIGVGFAPSQEWEIWGQNVSIGMGGMGAECFHRNVGALRAST
jgi:hypothetical protein